MSTSQDARKVVSSLEEKLADVRRWKNEIEASSKATAFAAHVDGGDARAKLDNLNEQAVAAGREIASLEKAIAEGKQRRAAAIASETDARERDQAKMALGLIAGFVARGKALDEKLGQFVAEFQELNRDFLELQKVNYPPATWALVATNMRSATLAGLMFTELQVEHLPPHRRHSFAQVIEAWGAHVRSRAQARLDRDAPAKTNEAA